MEYYGAEFEGLHMNSEAISTFVEPRRLMYPRWQLRPYLYICFGAVSGDSGAKTPAIWIESSLLGETKYINRPQPLRLSVRLELVEEDKIARYFDSVLII